MTDDGDGNHDDDVDADDADDAEVYQISKAMKPCLSIVLSTCGTGEGTGTPWYGYGCWVRVLGTGAGVGYRCWVRVRVLGTGVGYGYGC